jgi:DNA-binding NtrC family response regulator
MPDETRKLSLLMVDDEAPFLESIAAALERRGIEVTTAQCGWIALDLLRAKRFDVAVIDIKMPGMNGDVLLKEIKQRWPELPVIILTAYGTSEQMGEFNKEGIFYFLPKPCDIEELTGAVRQSADEDWRKWYRRLRM